MKFNTLFLVLFLLASNVLAKAPYALFSPHQGAQAFEKIYDTISTAKKYAYITIYSWSDSGLDKAITKALDNGVTVKVILNPSLAKKSSMQKRILKLEELGAQIKSANQNMHEKFVIVDDVTLINSSANFSNGAKSKYSENFIFHENDNNDSDLTDLISHFKQEFTLIWNANKDIFPNDGVVAKALNDYEQVIDGKVKNLPSEDVLGFYSSSQNFTVKENKVTSKYYKAGKYITMVRRGGTKNQSWFVKDRLIKAIDNAQKSIYMGVNHFNIREVSDALIKAVKRGVDVKLAVDNQEFKSRPNNKEMTPQFVKDWKALPGNSKAVPPVRVKFYSHAPSPRHWFLNHHKFILIDYEKSGAKTVLLSGSYNISKNAEHNQYDNLVVYKGSDYKKVFNDFYTEFNHLWKLNRDDNDKPKKENLDFYTTLYKGSYPLHSKTPMSLTWNEVFSLRSKVNKVANGILRISYKERDCYGFNPKTKKFVGCPRK
jgi:phosphatidylserine/phosphatidylglycerophosphate/cardiolipin synthase-like enzyme